MKKKDEQYFATLPPQEFGPKLFERIDDYFDFLSASGRLDLYRRSFAQTYKAMRTGGATFQTGEQGELTQININHLGNIAKNLVTLTTNQRPAYEPRATNTDSKSQKQTILASSLLDYYLREKKLATYFKMATTSAVQLSEGYVMSTWDASLGEMYATNPDTGAPVYEGDIALTFGTPLDCVRDYLKPDFISNDWLCFRRYQNKFVLAEQYPEYADRIKDLGGRKYNWDNLAYLYVPINDSDDIPVWYFFHKQNALLPQGRFCMVLEDDLLILDGPNPYRGIPVRRMAAQEMNGTPFGYTVLFDLLPLQEAVDANATTKLSNQTTFGVQNVWSPPGNNLNLISLAGGMNLVESKIKPESLNLTNTPPEIWQFGSELVSAMEVLSAVNSAVRGDPEKNLKSGTAIALVQSMAIQFNMDLQQSYAELLEDVGTDILLMLRDFSKTKRVAAITGKSNRKYLQEFTADDLDQVNRVTVDLGNPLLRTTAGKIQIADALLEKGLITDPNQYLMVLTTGKLEPLYEAEQSMLMLIRGENEELSEGRPTQAMITDNHKIHVLEHMSVLSSPESRKDPRVVSAVLDHLQQHINFDPTVIQAYPVLQKLNPAPLNMPQPQTAQPTVPETQAVAGQVQPPKPPPGTNPQTAQAMKQLPQKGM